MRLLRVVTVKITIIIHSQRSAENAKEAQTHKNINGMTLIKLMATMTGRKAFYHFICIGSSKTI